jgi:hypothetical protein
LKNNGANTFCQSSAKQQSMSGLGPKPKSAIADDQKRNPPKSHGESWLADPATRADPALDLDALAIN